jgi:hypothetical protein
MKNSNDYLQSSTSIKQEPCSEKTCATCFANRGCIYEQYPVAAIHNREESHIESRIDNDSTISKRA